MSPMTPSRFLLEVKWMLRFILLKPIELTFLRDMDPLFLNTTLSAASVDFLSGDLTFTCGNTRDWTFVSCDSDSVAFKCFAPALMSPLCLWNKPLMKEFDFFTSLVDVSVERLARGLPTSKLLVLRRNRLANDFISPSVELLSSWWDILKFSSERIVFFFFHEC